MAKYQNMIDRIQKGMHTRSELITIRLNAEAKFNKGDCDAKSVINAIDSSSPSDKVIIFMGFCPDADFENRLDIDWKEKEICTFQYYDSEHQVERFNDIHVGDLIVLKKRHKFGKSMRLYGHGRVTGIGYDEKNHRYLKMKWSSQEEVIEVPLMACNSTVDVRTIEQVEGEMPAEFYVWLNSNEANPHKAEAESVPPNENDGGIE